MEIPRLNTGEGCRLRGGCFHARPQLRVEGGRLPWQLLEMTTDPEPDLKLAGLSIWVDGRQFPGNSDYFDGNWLNVRARMEALSATVKCGGSILMTSDFLRFRDQLIAVSAELVGEAELAGYEPDLRVTLKMQRLGHVGAEIEITPDHLSQFHRFLFDLDQSYLPALIASCDAILARYPVIGAT